MEVAELADPRGGTAEAGLRQCRCDGLKININRKRGKTGGGREDGGRRRKKEEDGRKRTCERARCQVKVHERIMESMLLFQFSIFFMMSYRSFDLQRKLMIATCTWAGWRTMWDDSRGNWNPRRSNMCLS